MKMPYSVMYDVELPYLARCVYGALVSQVRKGNVAEVGQREVAERLGTYQPNVKVALRQLAKRGHIEVVSGGQGRKGVYRLTSPVFVDEAKVTRMPGGKKKRRRLKLVSAEEVFG